MLHDLNLLFAEDEPPCDRTDGLAHIWETISGLGPSLLFLARHNGHVLAVDRIGIESHRAEVAQIAAILGYALRMQTSCVFEHPTLQGLRLAFAVRLSPATVGSFLGGLVLPGGDHAGQLKSLTPFLVLGGSLAWLVLDERAAVERAIARKDQLRIEHETLRAAHVAALAMAVEEQQKRVEAEQSYSQRLEREVQQRSDALREAAEDARRQSAELQAYSAALENANRALEQFYAEAEAANRAKSLFLANVSHEIRTPMTAILGYADLLSDSATPRAAHGDYLAIIKKNGQHLLEVINDILDIAKVEAGKLEITTALCSPRELAEDACSLLRIRAEGKGIHLAAEFSEPLPDAVQSDPTCIHQILVNLISNAVKFTEHGGVRVRAQVQPLQPRRGNLRLEVIDTGVGIAPDDLEKIFEPFTQTDHSLKKCLGGTGLGLTICRRLATALGGTIACESQPGKGSTFRVTLPVTWPPGKADPPPHSRSGQPRESGQGAEQETLPTLDGRILLVEDAPDNQRLISIILRKAGAEVAIADNGQVAVDMVFAPGDLPGGAEDRDRGFDLILMDMQMPVLDGAAATEILRTRGCTIPIIAVTAHAMVGEQHRCLDFGCNDYLTKPIDRKRLLSTVARYLKQEVSDRGRGARHEG
jgi:signal transduction histidine kinase/FixJ family two-component response regulator